MVPLSLRASDWRRRLFNCITKQEDNICNIEPNLCNHEYVNYGFNTIKMVCKHCDQEKS